LHSEKYAGTKHSMQGKSETKQSTGLAKFALNRLLIPFQKQKLAKYLQNI
jgi:hypothetical protein